MAIKSFRPRWSCCQIIDPYVCQNKTWINMVQIVPFLYPKEGRIFCQIIAAFIAAFVVVQSAMNMIDHARYGFLNGRHQNRLPHCAVFMSHSEMICPNYLKLIAVRMAKIIATGSPSWGWPTSVRWFRWPPRYKRSIQWPLQVRATVPYKGQMFFWWYSLKNGPYEFR